MAKKPAKSGKKAKSKKAAGKKSAGKKAGSKNAKKAGSRNAKKAASKKAPPKRAKRAKAAPKPAALHFGSIIHTDFSSHDPVAMKHWATKVLGWNFKPVFAMPDGGEYEMFSYSDMGGGGIAHITSSEAPGSVPYVHVAHCQDAFDHAVNAGAEAIMSPHEVMPGMKLAIVRAPGGATIGLSGP